MNEPDSEASAARASLARWALLNHPDLATRDAASQGYDVRAPALEQMLRAFTQQLFAAILPIAGTFGFAVLVEGQKEFHETEWSLREAPSAHALKLRDAIFGVVQRFERPEEVHMQVMPVQRMCWNARSRELNPELDPAFETVVVVRIVVAGMGDRVMVVGAE